MSSSSYFEEEKPNNKVITRGGRRYAHNIHRRYSIVPVAHTNSFTRANLQIYSLNTWGPDARRCSLPAKPTICFWLFVVFVDGARVVADVWGVVMGMDYYLRSVEEDKQIALIIKLITIYNSTLEAYYLVRYSSVSLHVQHDVKHRKWLLQSQLQNNIILN